MINIINVNFLAVLVSAIASMIVGFAWYNKAFFGNEWMKLKGYTDKSMKEAQKEMGKLYGLSFAGGLVMAYVLSHVMTLSANFYSYVPLQTGLTTAFWMWLGFILPVQMTNTIFGDKKWKLLAIDTGYQLASVLVMGAVLGLL